jgi:hypothetical protein
MEVLTSLSQTEQNTVVFDAVPCSCLDLLLTRSTLYTGTSRHLDDHLPCTMKRAPPFLMTVLTESGQQMADEEGTFIGSTLRSISICRWHQACIVMTTQVRQSTSTCGCVFSRPLHLRVPACKERACDSFHSLGPTLSQKPVHKEHTFHLLRDNLCHPQPAKE